MRGFQLLNVGLLISSQLSFIQRTSRLCILVFFFSHFGASAQNEIDFLTWQDFNYSYITSPNWTFGGDGGTRGVITSSEFTTIYLRPDVKYKLNRDIRFAASVAGFQTFFSDEDNQFEFRLAQEVDATWPRLKNIYFTHRLRNEERLYFAESQSSESGNFENRLRYRLGIETDYFNLIPGLSNIRLLGGIEYFGTFRSRSDTEGFSDSRISAGYRQLLKNGWSYSLIMLWQRSRISSVETFATDQYVLRLRVYLIRSKS